MKAYSPPLCWQQLGACGFECNDAWMFILSVKYLKPIHLSFSSMSVPLGKDYKLSKGHREVNIMLHQSGFKLGQLLPVCFTVNIVYFNCT